VHCAGKLALTWGILQARAFDEHIASCGRVGGLHRAHGVIPNVDFAGGEPYEKTMYMLIDTADSKFHVGEKWSYHTRAGEEGSTLTIVKVEMMPGIGVIVHISLDGLRLRSLGSPGFLDFVAHIPFVESALEMSVTTLVASNAPIPDACEEGYLEWRRDFDAGSAGFFTGPVTGVVDAIERAMNQ